METFLAVARGLSDLESNQVKRGDWIPLGMMRRCRLTNDGKGDEEKKDCDDFIWVLSRESELTEAQMVFAPPPRRGSPSSFKCNENADGRGIFGWRGKGGEEQPADSLVAKTTSRIGRNKLKGDFSCREREGGG